MKHLTRTRWCETIVRRLAQLGLAAMLMVSVGCNAMSAYVNNRAGWIRYRHGHYETAREDFERAIANMPENADFYHNFAASANRAGDLQTAEQYYRQALAIDPSHQPSYHNLALLMKNSGRVEEGGRLLQGWADTQPYLDKSNIELGWYRREIGDLSGAEMAFQQALQTNPKNHIAASHLGQIYQEQGRQGEAFAMYEKSLHRRWDQPQVHSRLASLRSTGATPTAVTAMAGVGPQPTSVRNAQGQVEVVSAWPLPVYRPGLWGDQLNMTTAYTSHHLHVQSPTPIASAPFSAPVGGAAPVSVSSENVDPAHSQTLQADFEDPAVSQQ